MYLFQELSLQIDWAIFSQWTFWKEVIIFLFFLVGLFIIREGLRRLFLLRILDKKSKMKPVITSFLNWATFYGIILFILLYFSDAKWMFEKIFTLGNVDVSLFLIIIAILIISFANRTSNILKKFLLPGIYDKYQLDRGLRYTFDRIFHYTIMLVAVMISLTTVGVNLNSLTVVASVVGLGIGFGMQNITSNFISGLIILFESPIKVGDRVIINDIIGDVEKINMRATIVRTLDNEHIIIPNSFFLEEKVINRSYGDPILRLVIPVGVAYGSDVNLVRQVLEKAVELEKQTSREIVEKPQPFVNFVGFGNSSLDFELFVWVSNPEVEIRVKSNLRFRINQLFKENNIEIPFPQRDLHLRSIDNQVFEQIHKVRRNSYNQ